MDSKKKSFLRCAVPTCRQKRADGISFHKFPDKKTERARRSMWLQALKLKFEPTDSSRVCSKHFTAADFYAIKSSNQMKLLLRDNATPLIVDVTSPKRRLKAKQRSSRAMARESKREAIRAAVEMEAERNDVSFCPIFPEPSETRSVRDATVQVDTLDLDRLMLAKIRRVLDIRTEEQLTAWTGLGSFKLLDVLCRAVEIFPETDSFSRRDLSIKNLILLVMIKLKTNLSFRCISTLFEIAPKTASKYFQDFVPIFAEVMRVAVPWPSKEMIKNDTPHHFRKFSNVRAILDCTEIPLQRSSCLHCRVLTYSHYKGRETAKYLVSVTPGGCFNYMSYGFVGKASDKFIFNASDMACLFEPGDSVMVDKGFAIAKELAAKELNLIRPPMLFKSQLSTAEATTNISIAGARVHVERGIQRLKVFKILVEKFDSSLVYLMDDIMLILAGITNLSAPILADDKFIS